MSSETATSTARATQVTTIAPQFLVDDLERSIAYYRDKLGFTLDFVYESFYASVSRDGRAIHLKHGPRFPGEKEFRQRQEHLDAYIGVSGVHALYEEIQGRGATVIQILQERPWNCTDFNVEDPDGYILCFSELKE